MTDRKRESRSLEEVIQTTVSRIFRKASEQLDDAPQRAEDAQQEVDTYVRERQHSIRSGARRAGKRFSL